LGKVDTEEQVKCNSCGYFKVDYPQSESLEVSLGKGGPLSEVIAGHFKREIFKKDCTSCGGKEATRVERIHIAKSPPDYLVVFTKRLQYDADKVSVSDVCFFQDSSIVYYPFNLPSSV